MSTTISVLLELANQKKITSDTFSRALNAAKVRACKSSGDKASKFPDGGGMLLFVSPGGHKTWRYRFRLEGREQTLTIGAYPEVSLEEARVAHRAARGLVERGISPIYYAKNLILESEKAERESRLGTFLAVLSEWLKSTDARLAPRTAKHRRAMIENHLLPALKHQFIRDISRRQLAELLGGIDEKSPEVAKQCRGYINQVFEFAMDREMKNPYC